MTCFYHPDRSAVGICKHCNRGVCATCAAAFDFGLACKDRCEAPVQALEAMIGRNRVLLERSPAAYARAGLLYGVLGVALLVWAVATWRTAPGLAAFMAVLGVLMAAIGGASLRTYGKSRAGEGGQPGAPMRTR